MMTGEDASLGTRKVRYDDLDYCMEAFGTSGELFFKAPSFCSKQLPKLLN